MDLDDTHLCIKCSSTIVGLEIYIEHRKSNCSGSNAANRDGKDPPSSESNRECNDANTPANTNLERTYESFEFPEPEPPLAYANKSVHGSKTAKSLSDAYDLPYELGADVFFSSLQLQSVQSTAPSTSGKTVSTQQTQLQRQKLLPNQREHCEHADGWIDPHPASPCGHHNTDTLMKAVSDMSEVSEVKKRYETIFKPISFVHESPEEASEDDEDDGDGDCEIDEDEEEYDRIAAPHTTGGKWKFTQMRHSPPVVPATHTGGKWKPENRPNLRATHSEVTRLSPNWDEHPDEGEVAETAIENHPPADHTKGKWIPGTKVQRLEYKEEVELAKSANQEYWCNICGRKLKSKIIYENHLKTSYHLKRAEPEEQLEKAALDELQHGDISKSFALEEARSPSKQLSNSKKRKRRCTFIKCELCKHVMSRYLIGKHLISHYHYRRMQKNPGKSLRMILDNIHSVVLQSPFQCRPCRFYANTEETFLLHWNSAEHLDASEGPGKFWCSYCNFECEDNNQMRRHLLSSDHKEVILAINRSVPICISKKLSIDCGKCRLSFTYNIELRKHMQLCHPGAESTGTASDGYQSRYQCDSCKECFHSKVSLQRHEKSKHSIWKYFCSICKLEFNTPCKARRHRKTLEHRLLAASAEKMITISKRKPLPTKHIKSTRECDKCNFVATSEVEAMLHELSHRKTDFTRVSVITKASTSKHASVTTRKPLSPESKEASPIKCKDCNEICETLQMLNIHRNLKHPLFSHICMSCGQSFALAQALGRHSRHCKPKPSTSTVETSNYIDSEKSWKCEECSFRASYESELIYHRLHHTYGPLGKNQLLKCPLCTKAFRKDSLRCHLRQHTDEKIFECQFCNLKFSRRHNLKDHIYKLHKQTDGKTVTDGGIKNDPTSSTQKGKCQCDTCGKVFATKYSLKMHGATHGSVERKFACSYEGCQYAALSNAILRVHLKSHSLDSFKCNQNGCGYVGKSMLHLRRHSQKHTADSKQFACDKCDFKARIKGHIQRHMRLHTGEKPHKCPHCDFRCSTFDNLRKHVLKTSKHAGKFIYECNLCTQDQHKEEGVTIFKTNVHQEYQLHIANMHSQQK